MSTAIEWTEETWNPTTGCDQISPGCDHCYALKLAKRLKGMGSAKYQTDGDPRTSGPGFGVAIHADELDKPRSWKKPRTVFVNSMSDLFHARVPSEFVAQVFAVMAATPQHTYQVLTKRPERMARMLTSHRWWTEFAAELVEVRRGSVAYGYDGDHPALPNVWLGTSIESDEHTGRADALRATPAAVRFISAEPLLGPLPSLDLTGIDWLIAGGESGPNARPMHPAWVRDLRDRCQEAGVAFFFKQWGEWAPIQRPFDYVTDDYRCQVLHISGRLAGRPWRGWRVQPGHEQSEAVCHYSKKAAGRELDGRTWDEYPGGAR